MNGDNKDSKVTETKRKMPEVPDLSGQVQIKKSTPFALDDFSSGAPVNTTKP